MPVRVFTIPFDPQHNVFHDEELSKFLLNKQVTALRPEFFQRNGEPFWTIFIEYESVLTEKFHEANTLDGPERLLFQRLREWRREKAEQEGIPVFIIANNRELLDLVKKAPKTLETLRDIRGFGKKKLERYGKELLAMIAAFYEQTPARPQKNTKHNSKDTPVVEQSESPGVSSRRT